MVDRYALAKVLVRMTFGDLMQVSFELIDMNQDRGVDRKANTPVGLAQTLYDWAEAQEE